MSSRECCPATTLPDHPYPPMAFALIADSRQNQPSTTMIKPLTTILPIAAGKSLEAQDEIIR